MFKRPLDILGSGILLVLNAPVFLLAAMAVVLDGGPVFYRQTRAGRLGHPFALLKFRSMRVNHIPVAEVGQVSGAHPLVTPIGRLLRRYKIDELPQLLNVLLGDMSLVGPRPVLLEQAAEYTPHERRRLEVRPGMTGWAQVNGNIEVPWPDRIMLDVWYVDHASLWLDLKILAMTVAVVLFGEEPNQSAVKEARSYASGPGWGG